MAKPSFTSRFSAAAIFTLIALSIPLFQGCLARGTDEATTYASAFINPNNANFNTLYAAVLKNQCVSCHSNFSTAGGLAAEFVPGDPANSLLYQKVVSGDMPRGKPRLPTALVQMIWYYIKDAGVNQDPVLDLNHVTFQELKDKILTPRCITCHAHEDDFKTEDDMIPDIEPGDAEHSILYNYIVQGIMPHKSRHLSDNNIAAFKVYIDSLPPVSYPPIETNWNSINTNLFQRSCVQCHSEHDDPKMPPLDSYEAVTLKPAPGQESVMQKILNKLQDTQKPMPPAHTTTPPSPELIQAYIDWMKAGAPNN